MDIPSTADQNKAAQTVLKIRKLANKDSGPTALFIQVNDEIIEAPAVAMAAIELVLTSMAEGKGLEMNQLEEYLSTQQAAELLNVSRPFVIKLLERGEIPHKKVGTHRRVKLSDLQAYDKKQQAIRDEQLDFLARQAQELNMGY